MKSIICVIAFAIFSHCIMAQEQEQTRKWRFSVITEAISYPYNSIKWPLHPGVMVGYNLKQKNVRQHNYSIEANAAYFYHPLMAGNCFMIWPEYRFQQKFLKNFSVEFMGGIGYKHNISDRKVYKKDDGKFKKVTDIGSPQGFIDIGFGFGYEINNSLKAFMDHRAMIAAPYGVLVPFGMHTIFNVGLQYTFKKS